MAALSCFPFPYQSLSTLSLTLVSMPQLLYFFCIFDVILVLPRFVFWPHLVFHLVWFLNTHTSAQKPVAHTLSASKSILQHNNGLPGTDLLGSRTSQLRQAESHSSAFKPPQKWQSRSLLAGWCPAIYHHLNIRWCVWTTVWPLVAPCASVCNYRPNSNETR